jgi:hypothetical protein
MSVLAKAVEKIGGHDNFIALPAVREDVIWVEVQKEFGLNVFELSALKNERCIGKHGMHLF